MPRKTSLVLVIIGLLMLLVNHVSQSNEMARQPPEKPRDGIEKPGAGSFVERFAVYGVIKPAAVTTMLAVNHGIVSRIPLQVGQNVQRGDVVIEVMEKETTRAYRSAIPGGVAKVHVTTGAAVTPGMPLSTVMNPDLKIIEVSLSPQEAQKVRPGASVVHRGSSQPFGVIERVSPLVDPDTGAVLAFVKASGRIDGLIGDVLPLDITLRTISDCTIVPIVELDRYMVEFTVETVSGDMACLKPKVAK